MRKKTKVLVLIVILISMIAIKVYGASSYNYNKENTTQASKNLKIFDYADLLTDNEEEEIYTQIRSYISEKNMDMVIVTIDDNDKNSAMEYADDFYDYNDFGIGEDKSGVLFLIDMDNRKMWISTTGRAKNIYKSATIDKILDYTYDKITVKDYKGCVEEFIKYATEYGNSGIKSYQITQCIFISTIAATIITIIYIVVGLTKHRNVKLRQDGKEYATLDLKNSNDAFLDKNVIKTRIETNSGGSGGGIHTGSSGTSHGGGGRSF